MGMCSCEGYGSQAVRFGIGYRNQTVLICNRVFMMYRRVASVNIFILQ